ncbi:MAG: sensor histidine kinase [Vicinamibacterales bacterium]
MVWTAPRRSVALIALIAVLLPSLAILQYRWLGELSGLEGLRARQNLRAATVRLSTEFDARLAHVYTSLASIDAGAPGAADAIHTAAPAGFVKALYSVERAGNRIAVRAVGSPGTSQGSAPIPAWLSDLDGGVGTPALLSRTLLDEIPAIVVHPAGAAGSRWLIAEIDMDNVANELIPTMLAGCFEGGIPTALDVLIIRDDRPGQAVYRSRPALAEADFDAEVAPIPLFAIHGRDLDAATAQRLMPDAAAHRWRVYLQHQSGALEATLGAVRVRNLAIGIGVLVLLAVSVGLLVASMHSMQRAAREQLELVARMSHELRTPLATITCAGENLADDVISTPAEARHYGELIKGEGRRLTKTIGDILLSCRLQATPDAAINPQPTDIAAIVESALAESRAVSPEGQRIDASIDAGLPALMADRDALKMALKNLVLNAVKYGRGGPVRVAARAARTATGGEEITISVEDEGPGIPPEERHRIFEPFFRGKLAHEMEVEGSGIGLSIVRQVARSHGGRVRVTAGDRQGARFVLQLPAMKAGAPVRVVPAA